MNWEYELLENTLEAPTAVTRLIALRPKLYHLGFYAADTAQGVDSSAALKGVRALYEVKGPLGPFFRVKFLKRSLRYLFDGGQGVGACQNGIAGPVNSHQEIPSISNIDAVCLHATIGL